MKFKAQQRARPGFCSIVECRRSTERQVTNYGNVKLSQMDPQRSVGVQKEDGFSGWAIKKMFLGGCSIGTELQWIRVEEGLDLGMGSSEGREEGIADMDVCSPLPPGEGGGGGAERGSSNAAGCASEGPKGRGGGQCGLVPISLSPLHGIVSSQASDVQDLNPDSQHCFRHQELARGWLPSHSSQIKLDLG